MRNRLSNNNVQYESRHYESRTALVAGRAPLWRQSTEETEAHPISRFRSAERSAEISLANAAADWDVACAVAHIGLAWCGSMIAVAVIGLVALLFVNGGAR